MNLMQVWIIAAIVVASWNWRLVVRVVDQWIWPRLGWTKTFTTVFGFKKRSLFVELLRWFVTAVLFYLVLDVRNPSYSKTVALYVLVLGVINLLAYVVQISPPAGLGDGTWIYTRLKCYRRSEGVMECAYVFSFPCLALVSVLWQFVPAHYSERAYVHSQTTTIVDDGQFSWKRISVARVDEIQRDGTTWFEIYANWENGIVYEVEEHPDHNGKLKDLAKLESIKVDRTNMLEVRWASKGAARHTPLGKLVLETEVHPSAVVLAQVVSVY